MCLLSTLNDASVSSQQRTDFCLPGYGIDTFYQLNKEFIRLCISPAIDASVNVLVHFSNRLVLLRLKYCMIWNRVSSER